MQHRLHRPSFWHLSYSLLARNSDQGSVIMRSQVHALRVAQTPCSTSCVFWTRRYHFSLPGVAQSSLLWSPTRVERVQWSVSRGAPDSRPGTSWDACCAGKDSLLSKSLALGSTCSCDCLSGRSHTFRSA